MDTQKTTSVDAQSQDVDTSINNSSGSEAVESKSDDLISRDELQKVISQRDEIKEKLRAIEAEKEAEKKKALEEQGKFKELYEEQAKRLEELSTYQEKYSEMNEKIEAQAKAEADGLDETLVDLVFSNNSLSAADKLQKIRALKEKQTKPPQVSPASERLYNTTKKVDKSNLSPYEKMKLIIEENKHKKR